MQTIRSRASCVRPVAAKAQPKAVVPKKALFGAAAAVAYAPAAVAAEADTVDSTIDTLVAAVKSTGDVVRSGLEAVNAGIKVAQDGYSVAEPYLKETYKVVAPIAEQAVKATAEAAAPALQAGLPFVSDAQKTVAETLSDPNVTLVVSTANKAAVAATPYVTKAATFIANSDATTLAEYGLGAVAAFYLAPPVLGAIAGSLKGYKGEITAAAVLDAMNDGNTVLIDLRSQADKERSGVPDVPAAASRRALEVELAVTEDKKLRGALRNPGAIEASVTCLQIASLKSVNKGTKIILMDKNCGNAPGIAKELASKGFGKVYIVAGGFDGRGGWVQSKLQIKPAATILSAPPTAAKAGTSKALPAPRS